jgi:MFS family permease
MSETTAVGDVSGSAPAAQTDRLGIPALVVATTISNLGNGITSLAIPWFVLVTTGSPARTGIAAGMTVLANVLSGMLGGAIADRVGFKRASIFSDLLSGVTVAIIPTLHFLGWLEFWHLLALVFAGAIFDAPGGLARGALVPRLARAAGMPLERANSAMQFADQSSRSLFGPVVAGGLIGLMGAAAVLYVDAATFAISILIIGLLVRAPANGVAASAAGQAPAVVGSGESFLQSIVTGFRFMLNDEFLRLVMPISLLYNFIFSPTFAVMLPVLARDEFGSAGALGLTIGAFGAGSAIGTLLYGWKGHTISRYWTFIVAVTMMTGGFWLLPFATSVWPAMVGTGLAGLATGPTNVLAITIVQNRTPEEMLGRIYGIMVAFGGALAPLGVFMAGGLIELFGLRPVMIAAAVGVTIGMLWVFAVRDVVRQFDTYATPVSESPAGIGQS